MSKELLEPQDILRRAHAIGTYYGFTPLSQLTKGTDENKNKKPIPSFDSLDGTAREIAQLLKRVETLGRAPQSARPLFVWHTNIAPGRTAPKSISIQFHALGADRAIADAVLIRAVRALVADLTKTEPVVRVNSMGDKETRARLTRELTNFFRRRGATLSPECVSCARSDVFSAAQMLIRDQLTEGVPASTDHLSENSRKHFESVLEYLESTDTPYELAPHLWSEAGHWTDTCFEVTAPENNNIQAWGSRYHELTKLVFKSATPSIGAVIRITATPDTKKKALAITAIRERKHPHFVFVHIGDEAKRESMKVADMLRKARIPLTQAIGIESLTEQMRFAEEHNPRYLLIMGRKEALERSVILRERATHTEHAIPLDALVEELKAVA